MKIRGKEITKKMVVMLALALFLVGTASAALINYVSNSIEATVNVAAVGLTIDAEEGLSDPGAFSGGITDTDGDGIFDLPLTDISSGGSSEVTIAIVNNAPDIPSADVSISLSYTDPTGILDPMNCLTGADAGKYDPAGTATCKVCGASSNELCIDGQEFEVVATRLWDEAAGVWQPDRTAATCTGALLYWDGTRCFYNFIDQLQASAIPSNPLTLIEMSDTAIPTGSLYAQIFVKTTLDSVNKVQIAPGAYALTVQVI